MTIVSMPVEIGPFDRAPLEFALVQFAAIEKCANKFAVGDFLIEFESIILIKNVQHKNEKRAVLVYLMLGMLMMQLLHLLTIIPFRLLTRK